MTENKARYHDFLIIAGIGTLFYFSVTLFKYAAGPDERSFYKLGVYLLQTGEYYSPKHHPLYAILIGLPSLLGLSALASARIAFVFSGVILWVSVYSIFVLIGGKDFRGRLLQTIFVGTLPGTTSLILYSGSSVLYMAMAAASIALTLYAFARDSRVLYVLCGALYGLSYLSRPDGLVLFVLLGVYLLLASGRVGRYQFLLMAVGFIVAIIPWQLYLNANRLFFSAVIQGGWNSSVWVDGPMKYIVAANGGFQFHGERLPNILSAFSKNVLLYTQHIGSIRVFPFFYMPFIGFVLLSKEKFGHIAIICLPIVATLPYLLFYVEARYLAPAALFLAVLAAIGLSNMNSFLKTKSAHIYLALIGVNLMLVVAYLIFGHETYAPYR